MVNHRGCAGFKENGERCNSPRLREGDFCLMHSPQHASEVAEARRLGGLRRRREATLVGAYALTGLETVADIRRILEIAILDTLGLENSIARNRTLGSLAVVALKSLEAGEFEERLQVLEQAVVSRRALPEPAFSADPEIADPSTSLRTRFGDAEEETS